jgi:hypothetical protein
MEYRTVLETTKPANAVGLSMRTAAVALVVLGGIFASGASQAAEFAISADYTYENANYSAPDSMFMIDSKPVTVAIAGNVPGLSEQALARGVRVGMISSPPITCCAGADADFRAQAPLIIIREQAGTPASDGGGSDASADDKSASNDQSTYTVAWNFASDNADGGTRITATANLYHGSELMTQAYGKLDLASSTVSPEAMTALVENVEGKLTPYPAALASGNEGGD